MPQERRFEGVDFSSYEVKELNPDQENLGQGFKCKRNDFATYLKGRQIRNESASFTSKCWIIEHEGHIAGYITLMADKLSQRRKLLKKEGMAYKTFPAIKIGWLAADKRAKGAGTRLLLWAIKYVAQDLIHRVGIRFITVDALYDKDSGYDASGFYQKFGFRFVNRSEKLPPSGSSRTMYFDVKVILAMLKEAEEGEELTDNEAIEADQEGEIN